MTNILLPLEAPIRKLKWGRHRASEFDWMIREHDKSHPFKQKRTETTIIFEREKSYPTDLALVLGDAIHNLRTALDLLASDLARLNGKSPKGVSFPFASDASGLKKQIKKKNFDRAGPKAVQLLHKIGPHRDGNKALGGLHDLDLMDKHQLILPVLHAFRADKLHLKGPTGELVADFISGPGDGFSITAGPLDEATLDSITFFTGFGDDAPKVFFEKPILETLESLAQLVGSIIESFRALRPG